MHVEDFPGQCGAVVIVGLPTVPTSTPIEKKDLDGFKEVLGSCRKVRQKPKRGEAPAFVQEILVVVTLNYDQVEWEEVLKKHGFTEVSQWINYNYGVRPASKCNKMFVLQSFDKEKMV